MRPLILAHLRLAAANFQKRLGFAFIALVESVSRNGFQPGFRGTLRFRQYTPWVPPEVTQRVGFVQIRDI